MRDFRVHSLDAKYVGPFEHLFIEFKEKVIKDEAEVHIFTGENGTGKSTILYLLAGYQKNDLIFSRIQSSNHEKFQIKTIYTGGGIIIYWHTEDKTISWKALGGDNPARQYISNVVVQNPRDNGEKFVGFTVFDTRNPVVYQYSFAMFAYSGARKIDNPRLEAIKEITSHPLENSLNFTASANAQMFLQWIANTMAREALALKDGNDNDAKNYRLSISKLENAIADITGSNMAFKLKGTPFDVFVIWNGVQLTFDVLPDGLKSIIGWLGDLLMRMDRIDWESTLNIFDRNIIIFLDEIDIHLHPAWQRKILPVVKKLFKNAQIFVSTHSPFVVGSVDGAWVYKLKKEGQYSILDGEPVLSDDAKSYDLILAETFAIKERFGAAIENELKHFYALRHRILINELPFDDEEFQSLAYSLAERGIELESIIGMELRQLKRIKGIKENWHA